MVCALSLAKHGIESSVFEQRGFSDSTGAGIQLSPNASTLLNQLPLTEELSAICDQPEWLDLRRNSDNTLITKVRLNQSTTTSPYYHVLRSSFVQLLVNSASANPCIELFSNSHVSRVNSTDQNVAITSLDKTFSGDFLIGCDGSQSDIATKYLSYPCKKWSGFVAYRAIVDQHTVPYFFTQRPQLLLDTNKHVVTYPLSNEKKVNCVFVVAESSAVIESWVSAGDRKHLDSQFLNSSAHTRDLISAIPSDQLFKWGLFKDTLGRRSWYKNRLVIAGDACHTILPFAAQGAALAIEDVVLLASLIAEVDDSSYPDVFRRYQTVRRARTQLVQSMSRINQAVFHAPEWLSVLRNLSLPFGTWLTKRLIHDYRLTSIQNTLE